VNDTLAPLFQVIEALDGLEVAYFVGGSVASAAYGTPRATLDADVVADLQVAHVPPFVEALQDRFYVDRPMIEDAIRRRGSFNVLSLATMFKVDVFVLKDRPFDRSQMERRRKLAIGPDAAPVFVASAEDIILSKLEWYRLGNEISDRQWGDVLGVLRVQAGQLDHAYLRRWAGELAVSDLLQRALDQAG
jgi:hypothetical protein